MYSTLNFFITATVNLLRISENNAKDMNIVPSYVNTCVEMLENDLHRKCTFDFIPKWPTTFNFSNIISLVFVMEQNIWCKIKSSNSILDVKLLISINSYYN